MHVAPPLSTNSHTANTMWHGKFLHMHIGSVDAPKFCTSVIFVHQNIMYKWKNHFSEMKGDVGMSHHEKEGNKKMPIPRQEIIDNPIPKSLFMYYAAVVLCVGTGGAI